MDSQAHLERDYANKLHAPETPMYMIEAYRIATA